ncbi:MAG: hypothetical protein KatS3mg102_2630 [Planctomycetota bacterium]|nr:MAG: hypothetical protein KatS3mg102_2630 [Planctomycetota bacterium]
MRELLRFACEALLAHRLRSALSVLGIAVGIAAVTLLTAIGEGTRTYILEQFTQFGTNVIGINPGKTETFGIPGVLGGTTHKLTIEDAEALARLPHVRVAAPVSLGQARVEAEGRGRSVHVFGVSADMVEVMKLRVRQGSFVPPGDPRRGAPVAVLGPTLARELFGEKSPLGRFVRIAGARLRVIGVTEPKGQILGYDLDDVAYVPVATALRLFHQQELFEIDVVVTHESLVEQVVEAIRRTLVERHGGREDFTITTQAAMLEVFGNVMRIVTMTVGGIGAISLLVGAIGILTIMWIAVGERTPEIGLLRALGARRRQVVAVFLAEAVVLAFAGGVGGLLAGLGLARAVQLLWPGLPLQAPPEFVVAALAVSAAVGLAAGVLPARRAAALDPVEALRAD